MRSLFSFVRLFASVALLLAARSAVAEATLEQVMRAVQELHSMIEGSRQAYEEARENSYDAKPLRWLDGPDGSPAIPNGTSIARWADFPQDGFYSGYFAPEFNALAVWAMVGQIERAISNLKRNFVDLSEYSGGRLKEVESSRPGTEPRVFDDTTMPRVNVSFDTYPQAFETLQTYVCRLKFLALPFFSHRFAGSTGPNSLVEVRQHSAVSTDTYEYIENVNYPELARNEFCDFVRKEIDHFSSLGPRPKPAGSPVFISSSSFAQYIYFQHSYSYPSRVDFISLESTSGRYYATIPNFSGRAYFYLAATNRLTTPHLSNIDLPFEQLWSSRFPTNRYTLLGIVDGRGVFASPELDISDISRAFPTCALSFPDESYTQQYGQSSETLTMLPAFYFKPVLKHALKECRGCLACSCKKGDVECDLSSIAVRIGLGTDGADADEPTQLSINSAFPDETLGSPVSLQVSVPDSYEVLRVGDVLRQVRGPSLLAEVVVETQARYHVHLYHEHGPADPGTGLYSVIGTPDTTVTIELPEGSANLNLFRVTRGDQVYTYGFDPAMGEWQLTQGSANGLRQETLLEDRGEASRTTRRTVRGEGGRILSESVEIFRNFTWGEELVESVSGVEPNVERTTHEYYQDSAADGLNYRRLRRTLRPSGSWVYFRQYAGDGRVLRRVEQFESNPYQESAVWPDPDNRSFETTIASGLETGTEFLKGKPTARRWRRFVSLGETWDVFATRPDVLAWDDPSNLATRRESYLVSDAQGARAGEPWRVVQPDGTMVLHRYFTETIADPLHTGSGSASEIEVERTVVDTGQPNATWEQVVDGTRSVVIVGGKGQQLSREEFDIATGLKSDGEYVREVDQQGRSTRIEFLGGGWVTRSYDCCDLQAETDREGLITIRHPPGTLTLDLDGNGVRETYYGASVTRAGITTHTLLDGLERPIKTILEGSDGALQVEGETEYDVLGRVSGTRDATGGLTTVRYGTRPGLSETTFTLPDGSTRIERHFLDGSLYEETGTAVWGKRTRSDIVQDGDTWVLATTETRLDESGSPTSEFITTLFDFGNRAYKTLFPGTDGAPPAVASRSFDGSGRLTRESDPDGVQTLYLYNGRGERESTVLDVDRDGLTDLAGSDRVTRTTSIYEQSSERGMVVRKTTQEVWERDGSDAPTVIEVVESSVDGLLNWVTRFGATTQQKWVVDRDARQRTETTTRNDGTRSIVVYRDGREISTTREDANGSRISQVTHEYDSLGRRIRSTDTRKGSTVYGYYSDGRIQSIASPDPDPGGTGAGRDPHTIAYFYFRDPVQGFGRTITGPDGMKVTEEYHPTGALRRRWGSRTYPVRYTFDAAGRIRTLSTWQEFNLATGVPVGGEAVTIWEYDERGRLRRKTHADGRGVQFGYTSGGRLARRTSARGIVTAYGYNDAGDVISRTYSDSTPAVSFGYDRRGRRSRVTDASGVRDLTYHADELATDAYVDGLLAGNEVRRGFDGHNRFSSLDVRFGGKSVHGVGHSYDPASRLGDVNYGPHTATYRYDSQSEVLSELVLKKGAFEILRTTHRHDRLGRLVSTVSRPGVSPPHEAQIAYDDFGERVRIQLADAEYWSYGYDNLGQVTSAARHLVDGALVPGHRFEYQFDSIGNRIAAWRERREDGYHANLLSQISTIDQAPFAQVIAVAAEEASVTVNGEAAVRAGRHFHRELAVTLAKSPVSIEARIPGGGFAGTDAVASEDGFLFRVPGTVEMTYDADGNLTEDDRWRYSWDAENRLILAETSPNGVAAGLRRRRVSYLYDSESRRVLRRAESFDDAGLLWNVDEEERALYDGWNVILLWDPREPDRQKALVWGADMSGAMGGAGGAGGLLFAKTGSGNVQAFSADANGNVVRLVAADSGVIVGEYEYGPFGESLRVAGEAARQNPWRFGSKYADAVTGMSDYGMRWYDANRGRWLTRDPLGESGGFNLYAYCNNAPIGRVDLYGLYPGLPGHGNPISPETSLRRIEGLEREFDLSRQRLKLVGGLGTYRFQENLALDKLWHMARSIDVHENNRFVFSCRYGWIDHGHLLYSAAAAMVAGRAVAWAIGVVTEIGQSKKDSDSAWSPEDLISNELGHEFGLTLLRKSRFGVSSINFASEWKQMLIDAGAVRIGTVGDLSVLGMIERDIMRFRAHPFEARSTSEGQSYKRHQELWRCACKGDQAKPEVRFY